MIFDPTPRNIAAVCRRIAPADLGGHPLFVVFSSSMPEELRPPSEVWGMTGPVLDISLRDYLGTDRRGPCIVINDLAIVQSLDDDGFRRGTAEWDEFRELRLWGTAMHELSHILSGKIDLQPLPRIAAKEIQHSCAVAFMRATREIHVDPPIDSDCLPSWSGHEAGFIRTLLHCINRAAWLGLSIADSYAWWPKRYGLSHLFAYRHTLQSELRKFSRDLTFADLRRTTPPKRFLNLWREDLRWWYESTGATEAAFIHIINAIDRATFPQG